LARLVRRGDILRKLVRDQVTADAAFKSVLIELLNRRLSAATASWGRPAPMTLTEQLDVRILLICIKIELGDFQPWSLWRDFWHAEGVPLAQVGWSTETIETSTQPCLTTLLAEYAPTLSQLCGHDSKCLLDLLKSVLTAALKKFELMGAMRVADLKKLINVMINVDSILLAPGSETTRFLC